MEIGRREFLKLLGISGSAVVVGSWGAKSLLDVPAKVYERVLNGSLIETWETSICTRCPGGCGIRVRLIDDIPVRVLGNTNYPINHGAVCPLGESSVEALFHPDRIKQPLKRVGQRGENKWEPISWDEAIETIQTRLVNLQHEGTPEKLVTIAADNNDLTYNLLQQFMSAYGSPNLLNTNTDFIQALPVYLTQGLPQQPVYDFENADVILNFDADVLDSPVSPVRFNQLYGSNSAEIIHFSPYQSRTAAKSSSWHSINVGTAAALALGIANVMVRDETYNQSFVRKNTFGFEDWKDSKGQDHLGFKRLVLTEYSPEKVADITGLPATDIIDIARNFADSKKALAICGDQAANSSNGAFTLFAVYCLNALKGNMNQPGGVLFHDLSYLPEFYRQGNSEKSIVNATKTPERFFAEAGPDALNQVDTLLMVQVNPLFASTRIHQFKEMISKVPFIVSVNSYLDESSMQADLILPEPSQLERWDASLMVPAAKTPHFGIQQPVIEPIDDTRQWGDVLLSITAHLGGTMSSALPWKNFKEYIQEFAKAIYDSGEGAIISETKGYSWIKFLKERGWQPMEYSSFREFWKLALEQGGWWNPVFSLVDEKNLYKTPSRKFEFFSTGLAADLDYSPANDKVNNERFIQILNTRKIEARGDYVFLPHYESLRQEKTNLPYQLLLFHVFGGWESTGGPLGLTQEMTGLHSRNYWNPWAELNPVTADSIGVMEDDFINIISKIGRITVKVKLRQTVMPNTVALPLSRFFGKHAVNPYTLLEPEMDMVSGAGSMISTRVRIQKALPQEDV